MKASRKSDAQDYINYEKYKTYKKMMVRYEIAKRQKFYFELLWIIYAVIEDRTSAFLYYIGFINDDRRYVIGTKPVRRFIRKILNLGGNRKFCFDKLYRKIDVMKAIVSWAKNKPAENEYQKELKILLCRGSIMDDSFIECLNNVDIWREKRNALTHALFIHDIYSENDLLTLSEEGDRLARTLDNAVSTLRKYSKRNDIRKKFNLQ